MKDDGKVLNKRESIKAATLLLASGSIFSLLKTPKAQAAVGEENIILGVIASNTLETWNSFKSYLKKFDDHLKTAEDMRKSGAGAYRLAHEAAGYKDILKREWDSLKNKADAFYRVGKDPLSNAIPTISIENEPLVRWTTNIVDRFESLAKKATGDSETREKAKASARNQANLGLAKTLARETRKKTTELMKISGGSLVQDRSAAERFASQAEPIKVDLVHQLLESNLRIEQLLVEFIEEIRTEKAPKVSDYGKDDYKKTLEDMMEGRGVLS